MCHRLDRLDHLHRGEGAARRSDRHGVPDLESDENRRMPAPGDAHLDAQAATAGSSPAGGSPLGRSLKPVSQAGSTSARGRDRDLERRVAVIPFGNEADQRLTSVMLV